MEDLPLFVDAAVRVVVGLAWPSTVLVLVLLFRKELQPLFDRLSTLRFGAAEAAFRDGLQRLESEEAVISEKRDGAVHSSRLDRQLGALEELSEKSPRAAVVEAWLEVERAIRECSRRNSLPDTEQPTAQIRALQTKGVIPKQFLETFDELRRLRNLAVHSHDFDLGKLLAKKYVEYSLHLAAVLEVLGGEPGLTGVGSEF